MFTVRASEAVYSSMVFRTLISLGHSAHNNCLSYSFFFCGPSLVWVYFNLVLTALSLIDNVDMTLEIRFTTEEHPHGVAILNFESAR
jgi:hypothetical protein